MTNTVRSFADKWRENPRLAFEDTLREGSDTQRWILDRNGFRSPSELQAYLARCSRILDAGCGNGRVTALLQRHAPSTAKIVALDLVSADVARTNLIGLPNVTVAEGDLLGDLDALGHFDFVYCQEVLHHTGDPRAAFINLCHRLAPGGEIAIYVYRRKAPIREFVDDFVRERISALPYEEALSVCAQITDLGHTLTDAMSDGKPILVRVPSVTLLGIEAGEYTLQRFIYHFFMKCYWNPDLLKSENVAINYDWYHPEDSTRHDLPEVMKWFDEARLTVSHSSVDPYGITVRGRR